MNEQTAHLKTQSTTGMPVVALGWQDLCGITRVRGLGLQDLENKLETGLGFPTCGQAMTMSGGIVANRWGPMDDIRQIPITSTLCRVPAIGAYPGLNLVLSESVHIDGTTFDCCTRSLLRKALEDLRADTGLELATALEHEFNLIRDGFEPELCMSLAALRAVGPFPEMLLAALTAAGIRMEAIEPEFGRGQYELSCGHEWGIAGVDKVVVTREIVRDLARFLGFRASFSPKVAPDQVGNGAHIHFSLRNVDGAPVLLDDVREDGLSEIGSQFAAGIIRHIDAIVAIAAPTPVSYLRLGPSRWSSGFNVFGPGNREAVLRVCDMPMLGARKRAASYNLEFRAADNCCNPYLVLAMIVRAGMQGIKERLPRPPSIRVDPVTLGPEERDRLGIRLLPASLAAALRALEDDEIARTWLPESLLETFLAIKKDEIERAAVLSTDAVCAAYARVY